jgi:hypothetical protein
MFVAAFLDRDVEHSPSSSTARHRNMRRPRMRTTISSKCQRPDGHERRGRRLADQLAELDGPAAHRLAAGFDPALGSSSSTSLVLSAKRK